MRKLIILLCVSFLYVHANLSQGTFKKLQTAQKLLEKSKYQEAQEILTYLLQSESKMVKSYAHQSMASLYLDNNKYKKAITHLEKVLELKSFKKSELERTQFVLSQLYLSDIDYQKSLEYALALLSSKVVKKEQLYENIALAYYYLQEYEKSITYIQKVINIKKVIVEEYNQLDVEEQKKTTKPSLESVYKILYSSYYELKEYEKAIPVLKYLIENHASKEEYWMQLVLIYQNQNKNKQMLSTLELAYNKGFINKERNIKYFISMLLQQDLFHKAALLIEDGLRKKILENSKSHFEMLVTSHINAKNIDEAIHVLNTSKFIQEEKFQLILANLYYSAGEYKKAIDSIDSKAFKKHTKNDGEKEILLALSYFELDKEEMTKKHLKKALVNKHEKSRAKSLIKQLGYKI